MARRGITRIPRRCPPTSWNPRLSRFSYPRSFASPRRIRSVIGSQARKRWRPPRTGAGRGRSPRRFPPRAGLGGAKGSGVGGGGANPSLKNGGLSELFPPMIIYAETAWALIAGAAALIFLSIVAWGRLNPGGDPLPQETRGRLPWVVGG